MNIKKYQCLNAMPFLNEHIHIPCNFLLRMKSIFLHSLFTLIIYKSKYDDSALKLGNYSDLIKKP